MGLFDPPFYLLHDFDERLKSQGAFEVTSYEKAKYLNSMGYAVYSLVNEFKDPIRLSLNLKKIRYFFVETDDISKKEIIKKLKLCLKPTYLIETKNGFHIYYGIKEDIVGDIGKDRAINFYENFNRRRLIPFFCGDRKVYDVPRILRTPGFFHWKKYPLWNEYQKPFLITKVIDSGITYSISELKKQFPEIIADDQKKKELAKAVNLTYESVSSEDNIFARFNSLNAQDVLKRLSGSISVNKEKFSFKPNSTGYQILVNGKSTGNWIDTKGKIGGGSNTNTGWLVWYQRKVFNYSDTNWKEIYEIIRKEFPEL